MKKISTNTRLHISFDMRHAYYTKTQDFLHIMIRLNPFGKGLKCEIINVLVDTFYLICNMPTLSDLRIVHWLTPPHPLKVLKVDRDFLLLNIPACPALYYVTMFSGLSGHMVLSVHCTLHHRSLVTLRQNSRFLTNFNKSNNNNKSIYLRVIYCLPFNITYKIYE